MTKQYQKLEFSKNKVKNATKYLVENKLSYEEKNECINILANYRSSHEYPMQSMIGYFRKKAFETDKKAIVVRRLKRLPSIIDKIKRFPGMQVTTMGDIGGIRIITKDLKSVKTMRNKIIDGRSRNKLISEKDYLKSPKDSGYRGIHLNYSYQGKKEAYKGFRIELQIRSKIQHAWATAVEVVGTFLQQNLKSSQGSKEWLNFFKKVSSAFSYLEEGEIIEENFKKNIGEMIHELKVIDLLLSFSLASKFAVQKEGFYLILMDITEKTVSVRHFESSFLYEASEEYRRLEQEITEDTMKNAVLVSADSVTELKKAYPNYFADTKVFLKNLKKTYL